MKTFQKPLTQGEETEYIRLLREGTPEEAKQAKDILIERNMRLVAHVAKKYQNADEDMEDLISIGCIGLIKAVDTFDDRRGRLATYACRCIDNELLMLLRGKRKTSKEVSLFEPIGQDIYTVPMFTSLYRYIIFSTHVILEGENYTFVIFVSTLQVFFLT